MRILFLEDNVDDFVLVKKRLAQASQASKASYELEHFTTLATARL